MEPDDLAPVEDVELDVVAGTTIDFVDMADVRLALPERFKETGVEVGCEDCANQPAHHEFREHAVASADPITRAHQVKNDVLSVLGRRQDVFDREREILAQSLGAVNEPREAPQPGFPLTRLHPFR